MFLGGHRPLQYCSFYQACLNTRQGNAGHGQTEIRIATTIALPRSACNALAGQPSTAACGAMQRTSDVVDAVMVNAQQAGLQPGECVKRMTDRLSLTMRRVLHVRKNLIRL